VEKKTYLIHEAAKEVQVESHVLRYWEEELDLPIHRNVQGHRIYTQGDIARLVRVKYLKEQGLQLRAVKKILEQTQDMEEEEQEEMRPDNPFAQKQFTKINRNYEVKEQENFGKSFESKVIPMKNQELERWKENRMIEVREKKVSEREKQEIALKMKETINYQDENNEKIARMQFLLQKMLKNVLVENNDNLIRQMSENIKNDICKELDYQFRVLQEQGEKWEEEREHRHWEQQEEHYRKVDELLRKHMDKNAKQQTKASFKESKIFKFINQAAVEAE